MGDEVTSYGLDERIKRANKLAFVRDNQTIVGIAALKSPDVGYKKRLFTKSESNLEADEFLYELGWVFVRKEFRGKGHSQSLVQSLLNACADYNVYATSREANGPMHTTLKKYGFTKVGIPWASRENLDENLLLFVLKRS
jgi:predicted GNAT family N-acyltransferase